MVEVKNGCHRDMLLENMIIWAKRDFIRERIINARHAKVCVLSLGC